MCFKVLIFYIFLILFISVDIDCQNLRKDHLRTAFGLEFFKLQPNKNLAISPLMLLLSLCKVGAVSNETTQKELLNLLGKTRKRHLQECYKPLKLVLNTLPEYDAILLNTFFVNESTKLNDTFYNDTIPIYGVAVKKVGFVYPRAAATFINNWASDNSFKRIKEIVKPKEIQKNTTLMGVNIVYFKTFWEFPFQPSRTRYMSFSHIDMMTSIVPMMTGDMECMYLADDITDSVVLEKKLAMWGGTVLFVLPNNARDLPDLLKKLQMEDDHIERWKNQMKWTSVMVNIPRFQIKTHVNWRDYIDALSLFNKTSSVLSQLATKKRKRLFLSDIKQNVFVDIDEGQSNKYQPGSGQDLNFPMSLKNRGPSFIANRPFYFRICLNYENNEGFYDLVTGVYYGPEKEITTNTTTTKLNTPDSRS